MTGARRGAGRLFALAAMAMALVGASCGETRDDADQVASTVRDLQSAFADGDWKGVCARISDGAKVQVGKIAHGSPTACGRDLARAFTLIEEGGGWLHRRMPEVVDVDVDADRATATVSLGERSRAGLPLVRQGGEWKLDSFAGTPTRQAEAVRAGIRSAAFPATRGEAVGVRESAGSPCGDLVDGRFPEISGGCQIDVTTRRTKLTVTTVFGDFRFAVCPSSYPISVDSRGRTWTGTRQVAIPGGSGPCGDINSCLDEDGQLPWRGRLGSAGDGTVLHVVDACFETCVGYFVGEISMRLTRHVGGWRAELTGDVGDSGLRLQSALAVDGDLAIATSS
jgi:hypothetical protein